MLYGTGGTKTDAFAGMNKGVDLFAVSAMAKAGFGLTVGGLACGMIAHGFNAWKGDDDNGAELFVFYFFIFCGVGAFLTGAFVSGTSGVPLAITGVVITGIAGIGAAFWANPWLGAYFTWCHLWRRRLVEDTMSSHTQQLEPVKTHRRLVSLHKILEDIKDREKHEH